VVALLAFALARPTLRGSIVAGKEDAPVATALVFDNSLRMRYEQGNKTRLQEAQELAGWLLEQLPGESPVTVVDRGGRQRGQEMDRSSAELRVERLDVSATVRPMEDALRDAMRWLEERPDHRGEIYVFTDLSSEAWPQGAASEFGKWLDEAPGTNVYLIDVGARRPWNLRLGGLRLSSEQLAPGGLLHLEMDVSTVGDSPGAEETAVELFVGEGAEATKRGQQIIALGGEGTTPVEFSLSGLVLGTHQGFVRSGGSDPLAIDDVRYFTVEVRPAAKALLLGEGPMDTLFLREALQPTTVAGLAQPKFACDSRQYSELEKLPLIEYAATFLVDPPPLPDSAWKALVDFADEGGGVGVFLGRRARREEMNRRAAQQLLPAKLRWQSRDATYLRPVAVEHPALRELGALGDAVPWAEFPVFQYWELEAGAESAHVVASFANGKPALLERSSGGGRVLMMTTPVSDPAYADPWNLLPTGPEPWPFLALVGGIADYLAGADQSQLNYLAGQTARLPLEPQERVTSYVLQLPDGSAARQLMTPDEKELSLAATELPGNYRVRAGGRQERLDRGFSVNLSAESTELKRVDVEQLVAALGKDRARVAGSRDEIEVRVGLARTGRELFPIVILVVALLMAGEHWLANRFYEGPSAVGSRRSARSESVPPVVPTAESRKPTASIAS
jgi:hypothetical protein